MFLMYIRNRIGETGEPCGIPILTLVFSCLFLLNANCRYLLFIKYSIQLHKDLDRFKL